MKMGKNIKKLSVALGLICSLSVNAVPAFASVQNDFDMSQGSNSRKVVAVAATNIADEAMSGRINISQGSNSRDVVAVPATNIAEEELVYNPWVSAWTRS